MNKTIKQAISNPPQFITFTGADDQTDIGGMVELASQYPIEWGILFLPKRQGRGGRYPAIKTIEKFFSESHLAFSAHLCGQDSRDVIETGGTALERLLRPPCMRVQINTANPKVKPQAIADWASRLNVRAILQCRNAFPSEQGVDWLFDPSGGRGIYQTEWPTLSPANFGGYAGGLRPENVQEALGKIQTCATKYWIDMESGVRDDSDRFSLDLCRQVCEAVYGKASA